MEHRHSFWLFMPPNFRKKGYTDIESSRTQRKLLIETLRDEMLTVASRKTEFKYLDESDQISFFGSVDPSGLRCNEVNAIFYNRVCFTSRKVFDRYPDGRRHPVVLVNKRFDS